ncbi:Fungal pheromone STE3 GPCR [Penicillium cf. griseofulvum]|nr:Fungal pheromone STE3 GPCR [Penicillium cf. griseofulvum]
MDIYRRLPQAVVLPILSSFSIVLAIPPLILHGKNRNFPATSLIFWSILLNLFNITNSLIWPTDDVESWWDGAGLCDIEVKFMTAGYVAIPGSLACIFRSLAIVLDTDRATLVPSKRQRWRNQFVEILFCVVVPVIAMVTHIIWQKSRYLLFAISGCVNNFDESWVSLVFAWIWPPIICLIAAYHCCLVLIRVHKYRSDFANIIRASSSNLSKSRFLRLFFLALSMLICILPLQGYVVYNDIVLSLPWHPYSWRNIHRGEEWHTIVKYPIDGTVFFDRWTPVASGFMIFIFFGFGRDATRMYSTVFWCLGLSSCFPSIEPPTDTHAAARTRLNSHNPRR